MWYDEGEYGHDEWYDDGEYDDMDDEELYQGDPSLSLRERLSMWFYYTRIGQLIERFRRWQRRNDEFEIPY